MFSKYVNVGDKIELTAVDTGGTKELVSDKTYVSKVYDILSEDRLEITMPMEKTKLILLPVDGEFDLVFFTANGLYQCFARIVDRYKSNNVYLLALELQSNLRKHQRREFYRYSCALEMCARPLEKEEISALEKRANNYLAPGLPLERSVIVDISGGGIRFMSSHKYDIDTLLYCTYHLLIDGVMKEYSIVGKVLQVRENEGKPDAFEHRVKYVDIDNRAREEIIKFIFQEERKSRRKESGL